MSVSGLFQAIRIIPAMPLAVLLSVAACGGDDIAWSDPLTLPVTEGDARLLVDGRGRTRMVADTSVSVVPTPDAHLCAGSVRASRQDDGSLTAVWWSVRDDSSALLLAAVSPDGGRTWRAALRVDTADVASVGCNRPPPAISANAGVGVFYAHSMNEGKSYEPAVTILYGDRLTRAAIASEKGNVAVAYEDPSGSTPQIGLALSRDWGHIFRDRVRGSTGVGAATNPQVAVAGRHVAVSWIVGSIGGDSDATPTRIVRVGRLE